MQTNKVHVICSECGDEGITIDASAEWDVDTQEWVLGSLHDYTYCSNCGGESSADECTKDSMPAAGTTVAVMVDSVSSTSSPGFHIMDTAGEKYYIYDDEHVNPYSAWKLDEQEKHQSWKGVVQPGDLVVLRKQEDWRWEIVKEDAEAATGE